MTSLVQILLYVWIAITTMMLVAWYLRRRSAKSNRPTEKNNAAADQAGTVPANGSSPVQVEHPAKTTPDRSSLQVTFVEDDGNSDDEPEEGLPEPVAFGVVTTDTIEFDMPDPIMATSAAKNEGALKFDDDTMKAVVDTYLPSHGCLPDFHGRTLMDMLDGITLPYDLTPITSAVEDQDRHLIFLTTHSNATEVGTRFADELIELGFHFSPVGLDQAVAVRDDDVVSMSIIPEACEVTGPEGRRYGSAGPGDVALELWTGRSPAPPTASDSR